MKDYLRIRSITEPTSAGIFPNIEQHDGSRSEAQASHSREIKVKVDGVELVKKEHFGFVLDTPHNRIVNLLSPKLAEVSEFVDGQWVALDVDIYKALFLKKAVRRTASNASKASVAAAEPAAEGAGGDDDTLPTISGLADILALEVNEQVEALSSLECPEEILAEAFACTDKRLSKKAKKVVEERMKELQAKRPNAPAGDVAANDSKVSDQVAGNAEAAG